MQRMTRKLNPVIASYELIKHALGISTAEKKELGVVISDNLSWGKQVCSKSITTFGFVRRNSRCIKNVSVRRSIYLTLLRSDLGYATQVWAPQSIELVCKVKWIQRRASKFILNLPFHCQQSHKDRPIQLTCFP